MLATIPFATCTGRPLETLASPGTWSFAAIVASVVVGALLVEGVREHRRDDPYESVELWPPGPLGASRWALVDDPLTGVLEASDSLRSPLGGRSCSAWAVWLERDGAVLLHRGEVESATVHLNDGRIVRLGPGCVRFDGATSRRRIDLSELDPLRARFALPTGTGRSDPFPADAAWEAVLCHGDELILAGDLEQSTGTASSYRSRDLTLTGIPTLGGTSAPRSAAVG